MSDNQPWLVDMETGEPVTEITPGRKVWVKVITMPLEGRYGIAWCPGLVLPDGALEIDYLHMVSNFRGEA